MKEFDLSENFNTRKREIFLAEVNSRRKYLTVVKRLKRVVKLLKEKDSKGETILCETMEMRYNI